MLKLQFTQSHISELSVHRLRDKFRALKRTLGILPAHCPMLVFAFLAEEILAFLALFGFDADIVTDGAHNQIFVDVIAYQAIEVQ